MVKVSKFEVLSGEKKFTAVKLTLENAVLTLLSEGEERFGTLAVAIPQRSGMLGPSISSVLLGDRESMLTRMLAEQLAHVTGKISLVSLFTRTVYGGEAAKLYMRLFDGVLKAKEREL
ncbi:hypothetical protein J7L06_04405 [Candidatus Bathyarchaeota archaeon]|nr:hypothetical protein [Candidatus Bathyarchaeota archaeon]